jgi:hypothetical protein
MSASTYHVVTCRLGTNAKEGRGCSTSIIMVRLSTEFSMRSINVKLSLFLTNYAPRHEGIWRSGCIDPHFLDLSSSWR